MAVGEETMRNARWLAVCLAAITFVVAACATGPATGGTSGANTPPHASIVVTPTSGQAPLVVTFDASESYDSNGSIAHRVWNFGDGSATVDAPVAVHTYPVAGDYTASVIVTDNSGA